MTLAVDEDALQLPSRVTVQAARPWPLCNVHAALAQRR